MIKIHLSPNVSFVKIYIMVMIKIQSIKEFLNTRKSAKIIMRKKTLRVIWMTMIHLSLHVIFVKLVSMIMMKIQSIKDFLNTRKSAKVIMRKKTLRVIWMTMIMTIIIKKNIKILSYL